MPFLFRTFLSRLRSAKPCSRAFALLVVVLLTFAASLAIVTILDRQANASLAVRRQVSAYQHHHTALGMREMITRWLSQFRGDIAQNIDSDGLAFTLSLTGHHTVRVLFTPGQDKSLTDTSQLTGRRLEIVSFMREFITANAPNAPNAIGPDGSVGMDRYLRPVGPSTISINTADPLVIAALVTACVEPENAQLAMDTLMSNQGGRNPENSGSVSMSMVIRDLRITEQAKQELQAMVAPNPTLWFVTCEELDSAGNVLWRAGGYMDASSVGKGSLFDQGGSFLTWEELPIPSVSDR